MIIRKTNFKQFIFTVFLPIILGSSHGLSQVTEEDGLDFETQTIQLAITAEPPQLNHMLATDAISSFIIEHLQEGLLRKNNQNQLVAGIADSWIVEDTTVTFFLKENAIWSNGEPVTAHDFVFAWRHVLAPNTGSKYASIMYPIKNAAEVNQGQMPVESLALRAIDDRTLQVELASPTAYFLELMTHATFYPVQEKFFLAQNGRFGAEVETMLYSGPFVLSQWTHGASLRLEKNPLYWNASEVTLQAINIPYITPDFAAQFNLYKDGKLAITGSEVGLESEQLQNALDNRFRLRSASDGALFFLEFNNREERITRNKNLRKAIQLIVDTQELVNKVIGIAGYIPGESLIPVYLNGVNESFRQEYKVKKINLDIEKAREHLALAKIELGLEEIPPITLLIDDKPIYSLAAQYFQAYFKQTLDIDILIDIQTFKLRIQKMQEGQFEMVLAGWSPDYDDPFSYIELFASWNPNNHGQYASSQYDDLVLTSQNSNDPQVRMDAMGKAQDMVIDDVIVIPLYERILTYTQNPKLSGIMFKATGGTPIFTYAKVLE